MLKYSTRVLVDSGEEQRHEGWITLGRIICRRVEKENSDLQIRDWWDVLFRRCCSLTVGVPHLLLPLLHVSEVVDDGLRQVLQSPQLHLQRLQLLHFGNLRGQSRWCWSQTEQYTVCPAGVPLRPSTSYGVERTAGPTAGLCKLNECVKIWNSWKYSSSLNYNPSRRVGSGHVISSICKQDIYLKYLFNRYHICARVGTGGGEQVKRLVGGSWWHHKLIHDSIGWAQCLSFWSGTIETICAAAQKIHIYLIYLSIFPWWRWYQISREQGNSEYELMYLSPTPPSGPWTSQGFFPLIHHLHSFQTCITKPNYVASAASCPLQECLLYGLPEHPPTLSLSTAVRHVQAARGKRVILSSHGSSAYCSLVLPGATAAQGPNSIGLNNGWDDAQQQATV